MESMVVWRQEHEQTSTEYVFHIQGYVAECDMPPYEKKKYSR